MEGTDELISALLIALHTAREMIPLPVRGEDRVFQNARVFSVRLLCPAVTGKRKRLGIIVVLPLAGLDARRSSRCHACLTRLSRSRNSSPPEMSGYSSGVVYLAG
jgi:hypothetical protein